MDEPSKHTWSGESDKLLEQIRLSSLTLYKEHKNNYLYLVSHKSSYRKRFPLLHS